DGYVSCIDRERRILFLNRALTRDPASLLGERLDDLVAEPERAALIACAERAFASGEPQQIEFTLTLPDAQRRHLLTRFVPFEGPRGDSLALQFTRDVSEQRRLQDELDRSHEFRRQVVENLPEAVALVDREHRLIWINRLPAHLGRADVIGVKLEDFAGL